MAPRATQSSGGVWSLRDPGNRISMAEKTDYSPVVDETGEAEKRRERRKWGAFLAGAHLFWIYALIVAGRRADPLLRSALGRVGGMSLVAGAPVVPTHPRSIRRGRLRIGSKYGGARR